MGEQNTNKNINKESFFNVNDTLDINELASLNDDISNDFIEQLQNKISQEASEFTGKPLINNSEDGELFEEISKEPPVSATLNEDIDDNFLNKYKAKLNKQDQKSQEETIVEKSVEVQEISKETEEKDLAKPIINNDSSNNIETLTSGNIIEKPVNPAQVDFNESLDYIDDNVKYSKYVIYIDPENTDFIESLTVKERKNLINRIIREQDDIAITKRRLAKLQTIFKHVIIAVITVAIAIPITYWTINASLEATINNYRRSKTVFKSLYKEKGKIKTKQSY